MGSGNAPTVISGSLDVVTRMYTSSGNTVRLHFNTSEETELEGWRINWREIFPVTTPARKLSQVLCPSVSS